MTRARLPIPVGRLLEEHQAEAYARKHWANIEAARGRRTLPVRRAWVMAVSSALVAAGLVVFLSRPSAPVALHLADGREVPPALIAMQATAVAFDDASRLGMRSDTRVDVLESTGRTFAVALRHGSGHFDVHPGGPRSWRIECGGIAVEVVGTEFTVTRAKASVRVDVQRGAVLVRGEAVPDRVVRLAAGQSIVVPLPGEPSPAPSVPQEPTVGAHRSDVMATATEPAPSAPPAPSVPSRDPEATASSEPATSTGVASSDAGVPRAAEPPSAAAQVDALFADADLARREGRYGVVIGLLGEVLDKHGDDPRAPLAEFSLGRLYLDSLGDARSAAVHFARAIALRLPAALTEDAYARLVEAHARAGDGRAARTVAAKYRTLFPNGRHLPEVDRWTPGTP